VENLVWVGGLDGLGLTRRELLWQTGLWLGPDEERTRAYGRADDPQLPFRMEDPDALRTFGELDDQSRMVAEYRMLRFSTELHPLGLVRDRLPPETISSDRLSELSQGAIVTLAGIVNARQRPQTAKGYVFILIEDEFGHINVIVKPKIYEMYRSVVRMEPFLKVRGRLQKDGATLNVIALDVEALRTAGGMQAIGATSPDSAADPKNGRDPSHQATDPFSYLTALRQSPPDVKNFG
jgi:error-prone DNA polymerase